jgi:hypothetical protein
MVNNDNIVVLEHDNDLKNNQKEYWTKEYWTTECLVDQLFLNLCSSKQTIINGKGRTITVRKYYSQAHRLMKWIPIARPAPEFVISVGDLSPRVKKEIESVIDSSTILQYVLTQAVGRIFENIDFDYYHLSIARNLKVKFEY